MTKTVLITGSSSGIGYYCAKALVERGYKVVASCRKLEDVSRLQQEGIHSVQLDLASEASIESGYRQALDILGHIDVLFNNGAYGQPGAVEDLPTQALRTQFETNLFGWHHLTCLAIKHMRERGQGRIIQNSSVLGLVTLPYRGAYNASKFALEGLTDTLRQELSKTNIQVSLIEPGPIESKFRDNALAAFFSAEIDAENSAHYENYLKQQARLEVKGKAQPFTLGPEAVYKKLLHAIEAKRAKPRYYVTFPTYLFGYLKRILSTRLMDSILTKSR
ncbi:SDR family oxidoreductase [Pseudoalteromonas sp. G4]|uniref:SDR family oxidoreductase n=1 Tax=Pseudoalteromonas sp. G4 TaxID=2992761 RepID=UPI00237E8A9A|nr:SDR family oxidoreductase [Pseudoalteromonas sp. G4]MDE3270689.1 SDR family oxidoreductase [Pseudoalteromonas sp. G4]